MSTPLNRGFLVSTRQIRRGFRKVTVVTITDGLHSITFEGGGSFVVDKNADWPKPMLTPSERYHQP